MAAVWLGGDTGTARVPRPIVAVRSAPRRCACPAGVRAPGSRCRPAPHAPSQPSGNATSCPTPQVPTDVYSFLHAATFATLTNVNFDDARFKVGTWRGGRWAGPAEPGRRAAPGARSLPHPARLGTRVR